MQAKVVFHPNNGIMKNFSDVNINIKMNIIQQHINILQFKIFYWNKILKFQKNGVIHH